MRKNKMFEAVPHQFLVNDLSWLHKRFLDGQIEIVPDRYSAIRWHIDKNGNRIIDEAEVYSYTVVYKEV